MKRDILEKMKSSLVARFRWPVYDNGAASGEVAKGGESL